MSHTTRPTSATAVTVTPPAEAEARAGPVVSGLRSTHIHTGRPTKPLAEPGGGAISISGARNVIESIACCARARGSTGGAAGAAAPFGKKTSPDHKPDPNPAGRGQAYIQIVPSAGPCPAHTGCPAHGCGSATTYVHGFGAVSPPATGCPLVLPLRSSPALCVEDDASTRQTPVCASFTAHSTGGAAMALFRVPGTSRAAVSRANRESLSMVDPSGAQGR